MLSDNDCGKLKFFPQLFLTFKPQYILIFFYLDFFLVKTGRKFNIFVYFAKFCVVSFVKYMLVNVTNST